jgi:hypothetical protein
MNGLGCDANNTFEVNDLSLPDLLPVVTDSATFGCPLPTETQIDGLFGGDYDALLVQYEQQIAVRMRATTSTHYRGNISVCLSGRDADAANARRCHRLWCFESGLPSEYDLHHERGRSFSR